MKNDLNYAVELIQKADGILITAGAGMSVDSGLPDFRSVGGFWNAYPMFREHNINFEDIATPLVYQRNPDLAYWFYGHRLVQYRNAVPSWGRQSGSNGAIFFRTHGKNEKRWFYSYQSER